MSMVMKRMRTTKEKNKQLSLSIIQKKIICGHFQQMCFFCEPVLVHKLLLSFQPIHFKRAANLCI